MNVRKLAGFALVAFAVFYAITDPNDAAGFVHTVADGIASFATTLAHGGK